MSCALAYPVHSAIKTDQRDKDNIRRHVRGLCHWLEKAVSCFDKRRIASPLFEAHYLTTSANEGERNHDVMRIDGDHEGFSAYFRADFLIARYAERRRKDPIQNRAVGIKYILNILFFYKILPDFF